MRAVEKNVVECRPPSGALPLSLTIGAPRGEGHREAVVHVAVGALLAARGILFDVCLFALQFVSLLLFSCLSGCFLCLLYVLFLRHGGYARGRLGMRWGVRKQYASGAQGHVRGKHILHTMIYHLC